MEDSANNPSEDDPEKPLSPVLCSNLEKKKLLSRRRRFRRTSNKIQPEAFSKPNSEETDVILDELSFTVNPNDTFLKRLEKLEEIEEKRDKVYHLLVNKSAKEFDFAIPSSPAPTSIKKKLDLQSSSFQSEVLPSQPVKLEQIPGQIGFQTASSKSISISDELVKKHSKIFDDILEVLPSEDSGREKKFAFLSKNKANKEKEASQEFETLGIHINDSFFEKIEKESMANNNNSEVHEETKEDPKQEAMALEELGTFEKNLPTNSSFDGFKKASGKNIEAISLTKNIFSGENFNDIKTSTNIISFPSYSGIKRGSSFKPPLKSHSFESIQNVNLTKAKNIFAGENFDDLKASTSSMKSFEKCTRKNIFAGEDFDDLKAIKQLPMKNENKLAHRSVSLEEGSCLNGFKTGSGRDIIVKKNLASNIFAEENFEDLFKAETLVSDENVMICNKPNVLEVKQDVPAFQGFKTGLGKDIKVTKKSNIFGDENFDDLLPPKLTATELELAKDSKDIFEDENFNDIKQGAFQNTLEEFKSGKRKIEDIFGDENFDDLQTCNTPNKGEPVSSTKASYEGFKTGSGKNLKLLKKPKNIFADENFDDLNLNNSNFKLSSGTKATFRTKAALKSFSDIEPFVKTSTVEEEPRSKSPSLFEDDDFEANIEQLEKSKNNVSLTQAICESEISKVQMLSVVESILNNETINSSNLKGFAKDCFESFGKLNTLQNLITKLSAEKNNPQKNTECEGFNKSLVSESFDKFNKTSRFYKFLNNTLSNFLEKANYQLNETTNRKHKPEDLFLPPVKRPKIIDLSEYAMPLNERFSTPTIKIKQEVTTPNESLRKPLSDSSLNISKSATKRLGTLPSACKQISISSKKLERARRLFDEDFGAASPLRLKPTAMHTSTPVKFDSSIIPSKSFELATITPIRPAKVQPLKIVKELNFEMRKSQTSLQQMQDYEQEASRLQQKIKITLARLKAAGEQLNQVKSIDLKRPNPGILFSAKLNKTRQLVLQDLYIAEKGMGSKCSEVSSLLLDVTPQNADEVHFKVDIPQIAFCTKDEARIIPNAQDLVGLAQIEAAFKNMPGVDEHLLPNGWIRNHFKWIIWKLASYARRFPNQISGNFNVENVIQQLKYRYDREIDKAERPALRKIYEMDDVPQKRMVLCVSNIFRSDGPRNDLELTDGWYSIRTTIDEPLNQQILKNKIEVGTKLIISDAEFTGTEGCPPLEASDHLRLKISFNSTRRAAAYSKLGYQKDPTPFPILIKTINCAGGPIGCLKFFIARVYPVRYLDKTENSTWRNAKAEERCDQEWHNQRHKGLEEIQELVLKEMEENERKSTSEYKNISNLREITCPKTLFEILSQSNDPCSIEEKLSVSQVQSVRDYQQKQHYEKQRVVEARIKTLMEKQKLSKRDVVQLLPISIVDLSGKKRVIFNIWRPTDGHFDILKEYSVVTAYNIVPRFNDELSSHSKTKFTRETQSVDLHKFNCFKRVILPIALLHKHVVTKDLKEFDTFGLVIKTSIEKFSQDVWLSDHLGQLLHIKVHMGPKKCLLLDNLKRAQATTVCNLIWKNETNENYCATGNFNTIFSNYPQQKHLQQCISQFQSLLPKDLTELLNDCDRKIQRYLSKKSGNNSTLQQSASFNCSDFDETFNEESTLDLTRITKTDMALSLIDIDKFTE